MLKESKESIKRRMIRNASRLWDFTETQDVNSFDPIVGMIIGALAEELYNISGEIKKTDSRIVEKLLELLFSQNLIFTHFPAQSLVKLKPTQAKVTINDSYQFYYTKKFQKTDTDTFETKDIYFSPTGKFTLFDGNIKYLIAGKSLYEIGEEEFKEPITEALPEKAIDYSKIILGLELNDQIEIPDQLSLYFHVKNKSRDDIFYQMLSAAKCSMNRIPVKISKGLKTIGDNTNITLQELFEKDKNISFKANDHVNSFYENQFITISTSTSLKKFAKQEDRNPYLDTIFPKKIQEEIPGDLYWIEFELPNLITDNLAADMICSLNCVPVLNKELNEFSQSLNKGLNVIPLLTEDSFFDIRQISNSEGEKYQQHHFSEGEDIAGKYYIRQGGVERFDSYDAKESIQHLLELLRDESAAFSTIGADMISSELKQLDQIISRLTVRFQEIDRQDGLVYAMLQSKSKYERAHVQFWTTKGTFANKIRKGSSLSVSRGEDIDYNSAVLMEMTQGGREKLTRNDKLNKMRSALLSKSRIVTKADIKALCFEHFGSKLAAVEIKKGFQHDADPKKGFTQTLDIHLSFHEKMKLNEELQFLLDDLKVKLKKNSIDLMTYRFILEEK